MAICQLAYTLHTSKNSRKASLSEAISGVILNQLIQRHLLTPKRANMLIVYLEKLNAFAKDHAKARMSLRTWINIVKQASWKSKQDVLARFPKAKMLPNNRARFEIVHNIYRLIIYIDYDDQIVHIRFIGTHSEYDQIDPATI